MILGDCCASACRCEGETASNRSVGPASCRSFELMDAASHHHGLPRAGALAMTRRYVAHLAIKTVITFENRYRIALCWKQGRAITSHDT
jgi:hypothetical protein